MSLYTEDQQEAVYIRSQAKLWKRSALITQGQEDLIFGKADPGLKQTNIFFRIIFFIFTLLGVSAVVGLFFVFFPVRNTAIIGVALIVFSVPAYILAEHCVRKYSLYRYGIEEALCFNAVVMFCYGTGLTFFRAGTNDLHMIVSFTAAVCAFAAYCRFGFSYAPLIGIGALCSFSIAVLPLVWWRTAVAPVLLLCFFVCVYFGRGHEKDFRTERNDKFQAVILTALYFSVNLQAGVLLDYAVSEQSPASGIAGHLIYHPLTWWASYALTFIIPAAMICYGLGRRKRLVLDAAFILLVVSLMTNKGYLGMERYVWDPALLGIVLIAVTWSAAGWLSRGTEGTRFGFTARNILKAETHGIDLASLGAALMPAAVQALPGSKSEGDGFAGGSSGGGGAETGF